MMLLMWIDNYYFKVWSYNTLNKLQKALFGPKMLEKRIFQKDCLTNYSQSFSNLHKTPFPNLEIKEFCLKKSVFNPSE